MSDSMHRRKATLQTGLSLSVRADIEDMNGPLLSAIALNFSACGA
jgi:hypothetical protein